MNKYINALNSLFNGDYDEKHNYEEDYDLLKELILENINLKEALKFYRETYKCYQYENYKVLDEAIETYGENAQLDMVVEEMSELTKEICKKKRGKDNRDNIIEEMADTYIMLYQLRIMCDIDIQSINKIIEEKIERLRKRLQEE